MIIDGGDSPATGVVDASAGLWISRPARDRRLDHSGDLGANPALTITAQSERAIAWWPNKGEQEPRPPLGFPYKRIAPVAPRNPIVPDNGPAVLRLSVI
jgi:cholesterol oxidase